MKGIKSDWMRPLLYLESQSQEKVIFDNDTYIINKGALANATNLRFAFKRLLDSLCKANTLDENNFAKEFKQLKEDSKYFFKMLNNYIKLGFREMHENLKLILLPLRLLRKSAYRLFSIEQQESGNIDLFGILLNVHLEYSKILDKGTTNSLIQKIFAVIDDLIVGKMVCGAGGGGFLQVILKKNVTKEMLHNKLRGVFPDSEIDVWECNIDF